MSTVEGSRIYRLKNLLRGPHRLQQREHGEQPPNIKGHVVQHVEAVAASLQSDKGEELLKKLSDEPLWAFYSQSQIPLEALTSLQLIKDARTLIEAVDNNNGPFPFIRSQNDHITGETVHEALRVYGWREREMMRDPNLRGDLGRLGRKGVSPLRILDGVGIGVIHLYPELHHAGFADVESRLRGRTLPPSTQR